MPVTDDFETVRRQVEQLRNKAAEYAGAKKQLLKRLQERFECSTVEEGEALREEKKQRRDMLDERFKKAFEAYKKEFGGLLQQVADE